MARSFARVDAFGLLAGGRLRPPVLAWCSSFEPVPARTALSTVGRCPHTGVSPRPGRRPELQSRPIAAHSGTPAVVVGGLTGAVRLLPPARGMVETVGLRAGPIQCRLGRHQP